MQIRVLALLILASVLNALELLSSADQLIGMIQTNLSRSAAIDLIKQMPFISCLISQANLSQTIIAEHQSALARIIVQRDPNSEEFQISLRKFLVLASSPLLEDFKDDQGVWEVVYRADVRLWCVWFTGYLRHFMGGHLANRKVWRNLRLLIHENSWSNYQQRLVVYDEHLGSMMFAGSYIDADNDRFFKQHMNRLVKRSIELAGNNKFEIDQSEFFAKKRRGKRIRIAIISQFFFYRHSVFRNFKGVVENLELDGRFKVNLYCIGDHSTIESFCRNKSNALIFDHPSDLQKSLDIAAATRRNRIDLVYYLDVGMSFPSVFLSNMRLAPVQIASQGHSKSTFGSKIDFFVSGKEVEISSASKHYSEKLVLVEGLGIGNSIPIPWNPEFMASLHNKPSSNSQFVINCAWVPSKVSPIILNALRTIISKISLSRTLVLRFWPYLPLEKEKIEFLNNINESLSRGHSSAFKIEISRPIENYTEYLSLLSEGDMFLDSFPYGGCNGVVDALVLLKPIVIWKGSYWNNRIGASILDLFLKNLDSHQFLMDSLVANSKDSYISKSLKLMLDQDHYNRVVSALKAVDPKRLFSSYLNPTEILIPNLFNDLYQNAKKSFSFSRSNDQINPRDEL
jgi:predicted O-linked N-acetylglucosamine transferase (SPINDLY family)